MALRISIEVDAIAHTRRHSEVTAFQLRDHDPSLGSIESRCFYGKLVIWQNKPLM